MIVRAPGPRVLLALLALLAAGIQDSWRLWILGGLWAWWVGAAARRAFAIRSPRAALGLGVALLAGAAVPLGLGAHAGRGEPVVRGLHGLPPFLPRGLESGDHNVIGRADGPTGTIVAVVSVDETGIHGASFAHREPPWVGGGPLRALAEAIGRERRLPPADARGLEVPVARAGLRAAENALAQFSSLQEDFRFPGLAGPLAATVRHEDDLPTLSSLPAAFLLALAAALALARARPAPRTSP
ncbi:MAG: hypothetical protein L0216_05275 [Planctomycetales bacterium]|nr:hypothetical protein [Planctomycetales bacterium]